AVTPIDMTAQVRGLDPADADRTTQVRGQVEVATTQGQIVSVALDPPDPQACAEAVEAVLGADWVVLGPGSWFTSVIPHLMVPSLRQALIDTAGGLIVVLNLEPQEGETPGYLPEDHLAALFEHAPDLKIHTVLADVRSVGHPEELDRLVSSSGASLVIADLAADGTTDRHDDDKLAVAFERIMNGIVVPGD
ncbi:hypothetical protein CF8_2160, partial [Nocardioides sp. CF8]